MRCGRVGPGALQRLADIPGFGMLVRQFIPEAPPQNGLWDTLQLRNEWLHLRPSRSQRLAAAATGVGQKTIEAGDNLLNAGLLQIGDQLVKLGDILVGHKQIAACSHLRLPRPFNRAQALAVRSIAQHCPVVDRIGPVEGKPEGGRSQVVQRLQKLAPVGTCC